jgi:hypothetical protein
MNNSSLGTSCASAPGSADDYNSLVPVEVGVAANASLSGNKITVNYKLQAYAPEAGAMYYTSVIVCEKEVGCYQAGASGTFATHKHIVRASAHKNAAGTQLAFSESAILNNPAKDFMIEKSATFDYVATPDKLVTQINTATQGASGFDFGWWKLDKANTGVAVIVWKYISPTEMFCVNTAWADVK